MRAIVTIYDDTITSPVHLMDVGDLCRRAVNARDTEVRARNGTAIITLADLDATDDADELTDLLRTAVGEWTTAPVDVEIEAAA